MDHADKDRLVLIETTSHKSQMVFNLATSLSRLWGENQLIAVTRAMAAAAASYRIDHHCEAVIWDEDCESWPDTEGGQLCEMILDASDMTFQNQAALSSTELDNPDPSLLLKL